MCNSCQLSITIVRSVFSWSQVCSAYVDFFTTAFLVYRWRNMPQSQRKLCVWVQHEGHPRCAVNAHRSHWRNKMWRTLLQNCIGSEYPEAGGRPMSEIKELLHNVFFCAVPWQWDVLLHVVVCYSGVIPAKLETWLPISWCLFATERVTGTRRTGSAAGLMLTWARQGRARRGEAARLWKVRRNPRKVWNQTQCFDCISCLHPYEHVRTWCIFIRALTY